MSLENYFGKSTGSFPTSGCVGTQSEWLDVGSISLPSGKLWVGSSFQKMREDGCIVKVPRGTHRVYVKGMDFDGHRRPARGRVCLDSAKELETGSACGKLGVDGGSVAFCDIATFKKVVVPQYLNQFLKEFVQASMTAFFESYGIQSLSFDYGGQSIGVAFMPSGLGDGTYKVYPVRSGDVTVGMEVEFLPPNYKAPRVVGV